MRNPVPHVIATVVLLALHAAAAGPEAPTPPWRGHITRCCDGVAAGGGRIRACLARHEAELSVGCRRALAAPRAAARPATPVP